MRAALLRDRGFLAIIVASALIQGSHAAYYIFASITWQQSGLGGLTIAGLWALGVIAEIVVFALSPRFTLAPAVLVVIGALSAVARWLITAQEPSVAVLAVVQLAHGLTYGLTQVGTMGLLVRHVPGHVMARGQGYLAACSGIIASSCVDPVRCRVRPLRAGRLLRDGGDGAIRRGGDVAGAAAAGGSSPERGVRRVDLAAVVTQTIVAVAREQQRTIEIDEAGLFRQQHRRRHRQRGRDHAADHDLKSQRLRRVGHRQRLGQPARLVELDVDGVVALAQSVQ